jgi:hypothetical protein
MRKIETTLMITEQGKGIVTLPSDLEPGQYKVSITIEDQPATTKQTREPLDIPVLDLGPWPEGVPLRREDMYGDDGR